MRINKVIQRRFRTVRNGIDVAGDVNAAVAGNVGERGGSSFSSVSSSQEVKQDSQSTPPRRKED